MSVTFRVPDLAIKLALEQLKSDGIVHPSAAFNATAPGGLRREVAYYDRDLLYRVGRTEAEDQIVDEALKMLKKLGLVPASASYDKETLERHRSDVRSGFEGSWTSLSPTMERLVYMLTSVKRPANLVEMGSFWGYTLAWFAGPCIGAARAYKADRIIGIDVSTEWTAQAEENFARLPNTDEVELIAADARAALPNIAGPIDFLYIEAKSDDEEGLYLALLEQAYDLLPTGAWVIAHDNLDWSFTEEMSRYLPFVRDKDRFSESISFEIDHCGLELSVK